jgi:hypothetical protein
MADPWAREYGEAARLADDVGSMVAERGALPQSGPEAARHASAIRRKITILGTRLESLDGLLARVPPKSVYVFAVPLLLVSLFRRISLQLDRSRVGMFRIGVCCVCCS